MKIYTGTGDRGKTSLFGGRRVSKGHRRVAAYGDVDELNAVTGALAAALEDDDDEQLAELRRIQGELLAVGAWLAASEGPRAGDGLRPLDEAMSARIEAAIDRMQSQLAPLRHFVLPGGHPAAAWAHLARTVCRRAERSLVRLMETAPRQSGGENHRRALVYLNRLSDYFFVLARDINRRAGVDDISWRG